MKNEKTIKFIFEQVKLGKVDVEDAMDLLKELISNSEDGITINPSPIGIPQIPTPIGVPYTPSIPNLPGTGCPTWPNYPIVTCGYINTQNTKQTPK